MSFKMSLHPRIATSEKRLSAIGVLPVFALHEHCLRLGTGIWEMIRDP